MQPCYTKPHSVWRFRSVTPLLKCLLIVGWVAVACWAAPCIPDEARVVPVTTEAGLMTAGYQQIAADIKLSQTLEIEEGPVAFVSTRGFQLQCSQVKDVVINVMGAAEVCLDGLVFKGCNSTIFNIAPGAKLQAYNIQIIGSATINVPLIIINNAAASFDNVTISGNALTHTHLIRMEGGSPSLTISGNSIIKDNNLTADSSLLHADLQQVTKGEPVAAIQFLSSTAVKGNRAGRLVSVVSHGRSASPSDRKLSDNITLDTFRKNDTSLLQAWIPTETVPAITINGANFFNNDVYLELIALYRVILQVQQALFQGNTGWGIPVETAYPNPPNSTSGGRSMGRAFISQNIQSLLPTSPSPITNPLPRREPGCACCIRLANNFMPSDVTIQIPVFPFSWNDEQTRDCASHANLMLSSHLAVEVATPQARQDSVSFSQHLGDQKSKCTCDGALPPDTRLVSHMIGLADSFLWIEQSTFSSNTFSYGSILETSNHTTVILRESTFDSNTAQTILNVTAVSKKLNWTAYCDARYQDELVREWTRPSTLRLYADSVEQLHQYTVIMHSNMLSTPVYVELSTFTNNKVHTGILRSWGTRGGNPFMISTYDEHSAIWYIHDSKLEQNEQLNAANLVNASNVAEKYLIPSMIGFIHVNATLLNVKLLNNKAVRVVNIEAASTTVLGCTISGNQVVDQHTVWWTKWATLGIHHTNFTDNCVNCTAGLLQVVGTNTWLHDSSFTNNAYSSAASLVSFTSTNLTSQALLFMKNCTFYNNTAEKVFFTSEFKHMLTCSETITSLDCIPGNRNKFLNNTGTSLFIYKPDKLFQSDWAHTNFTGIEAMGNKNATFGTLYVQLGAENKLNISKSVFMDNEGIKGGAVVCEEVTAAGAQRVTLTVEGSKFYRNLAQQHGGAITMLAGSLNINDTQIVNNTALGSGGGIYADVSQYQLTNVTVSGNTAQSGAGLVLVTQTNLEGSADASVMTSNITNCTVVDNSIKSASARLISPAMLNCGLGGGGGLCFVSPAADFADIVNTTINNNKARYGGALFVDCGLRPIDQCRIDITQTPATGIHHNLAHNPVYDVAILSSMSCLRIKCTPTQPKFYNLQDLVRMQQQNCLGWQWPGTTPSNLTSMGISPLPRQFIIHAKLSGGQLQFNKGLYKVVSGSSWSASIALHNEYGMDNLSEMLDDIIITAVPKEEDLIMITGNRPGKVNGTWSSNLPDRELVLSNIITWPSQSDPNNNQYHIMFQAQSSHSRFPIKVAEVLVVLQRCTLGEYVISTTHACQTCSDLNSTNPLFSLHPSQRCEPCPVNGACSHEHGMLLPSRDFFQTSFLLPQILRCPQPEACQHSPKLQEEIVKWKEEHQNMNATSSDTAFDTWLLSGNGSANSTGYREKNTLFQQLQCTPGYRGLLCGACAKSYGRYFGRCQKCLPAWANTLILLLVMSGGFGIVAWLLSGHIQKTLRKHAGRVQGVTFVAPVINQMQQPFVNLSPGSAAITPRGSCFAWFRATDNLSAKSLEKMSHIFKVLTTFLQVNSLTRGLQWVAPRQMRQFFTYVDFTSSPGAWVSLDCSLASLGLDGEQVAIAHSIFMILLPVSCLLVAYTTWTFCFAWWVTRKQLPCSSWKNFIVPRLWLSTVQICYLLYPMVTISIFSVFSCDPLNPPQAGMESKYRSLYNSTVTGLNTPVWHEKRLWTQNYETVCNTGRHAGLMWGLGVPALIFFAVGIPVGLVVLLVTRRHKLQEPKMQLQFGFLYEEYKEQFSYWEAVIMARKVALLVIIIALPYMRSMHRQYVQISSCIVVMMICHILHVTYQPFTDPLLNRLETISILVTVANLYMLTYWMIPDMSNVIQLLVMIILLCLNTLVILYFLYQLLEQLKDNARFLTDKLRRLQGCCRKGNRHHSMRDSTHDSADKLRVEVDGVEEAAGKHPASVYAADQIQLMPLIDTQPLSDTDPYRSSLARTVGTATLQRHNGSWGVGSGHENAVVTTPLIHVPPPPGAGATLNVLQHSRITCCMNPADTQVELVNHENKDIEASVGGLTSAAGLASGSGPASPALPGAPTRPFVSSKPDEHTNLAALTWRKEVQKQPVDVAGCTSKPRQEADCGNAFDQDAFNML